jgi:hypothetical protein
VFEYPTYAHVPNDLRKKLNPKSKKCIFVGYGEFFGGKGYRIFDTSIHHVSIDKKSYLMKISFFQFWQVFFID